jgi:alpha-tubulin suppressor-like RCC1 family protein
VARVPAGWASVAVAGLASAIVTASVSLGGCGFLLGLEDQTPLPDGGPDVSPPDAAIEARPDVRAPPDAGPGGAVVVASSMVASVWCAVTVAGDVECWGNNESGELGDDKTTASRTPVKVKGLDDRASTVTVGATSACALTMAGAVYCWGLGRDGELGNGASPPYSSTAVAVSGLGSGVTAISVGNDVGCAVREGALYCWGIGSNGLLGTGQMIDAPAPVRVPGLSSGVTAVSVGGAAACAVKDGAVLCWGGFDGNDELGNDTSTGSLTPVPTKKIAGTVTAVSVGYDFACALTEAGAVFCWGDGTLGAVGNGQLAPSPVPMAVLGLGSGVVAVSAGTSSTSAILKDGSVVSWGYAGYGQLGIGSLDADASLGGGVGGASAAPLPVHGLSSPAISLSTGNAPCVATRAGTVECWGMTSEDALTPVTAIGLDQMSVVATGGDGNVSSGEFACAISSLGNLLCWGGNALGQLGNTTTVSSTIPLNVVGRATSVSAGSGADFACAVVSGLVYCWGDNSSGQLGTGTVGGQKSAPAPVGLPTGVTALSVSNGAASACALVAPTTDGGADSGSLDGGSDAASSGGAAYCWGDNTFGELGNGTSGSPSPTPVEVTGLGSGVMKVALGWVSACALRVDGSVVCWGANDSGQLGNGDSSGSPSYEPVPVTLPAVASTIAAGGYSACAIASGSVFCWGDNTTGELGDNNPIGTTYANPVVVAGIEGQPTQVAMGVFSACAIAGGSAQCWGLGPTGNDGAPEAVYSPNLVTGLESGVTAISVASDFACAVASGTIACWGYNHEGALGNGGAVDSPGPVRVTGFP